MKQKGFSLTELLVAIAIIGIIASIAIPSFRDNVTRSARGDGMTALHDIMRAQENYYANEFTYTTDLTNLNYNATQLSSAERYQVTASKCNDGAELTACVKLTATARGSQLDDGNLTLDSRGNRTHGTSNSWPN